MIIYGDKRDSPPCDESLGYTGMDELEETEPTEAEKFDEFKDDDEEVF